jgi:ribosome-associated protein
MTATNSNNNKNKNAAMLDFMSRPPDDKRKMENYQPLDDDTRLLVESIVKAADGRKAADIVALNVESITSLCSALVILSGNSRPQNQAIVKAILDATPDVKILPEGTADSGWMLLDYGGVMVHVMTPKSRLYYNVEGQWVQKGAKYVSLDGVLLEPPTEDANTQQLDIPQEQDPFWS